MVLIKTETMVAKHVVATALASSSQLVSLLSSCGSVFVLTNPNAPSNLGIYYDDVYLSFSSDNNSSLATYRVPRFYQGHTLPLDNQAVSRAVLPNGSAVF
ncbi:unnamed protein product, partial [Brassica oleracea]